MLILKVMIGAWLGFATLALAIIIWDRIRGKDALVMRYEPPVELPKDMAPPQHFNCRCTPIPEFVTAGRVLDPIELEMNMELDDLISEVEKGG